MGRTEGGGTGDVPRDKVRKGKTTHPTQVLMLSSGVPNVDVSLVPTPRVKSLDIL